MNIFSRTMLAAYAFCLTIVSVVSIFITIKPQFLETITVYMVDTVLQNRNASVVLVVVELIFCFLSILFLLSGVKNDGHNKSVTKVTNLGEIKISLSTIENIALATSKKLGGIKEAKASVKKLGDGVGILIKAVVIADINLPALMEEVQIKVNKTVQEICGIKVNEVNASVESVYYGYKSRVE